GCAHDLPAPGAARGGEARGGATSRPAGTGRLTGLSGPGAPSGPGVLRTLADSRRIRRGARLAPQMFAGMCVLALALLLAEGCLVPQSVDPIATRAHTVPRVNLANLPDYLLEPSIPLDPQESGDLAANPPCHCRLDVSIPEIIADDPTVDVDVRVFVEYDVNIPRSQSPVQTVHLTGSFETSVKTRRFGVLCFSGSRVGRTRCAP